jgi:CMP-N-acetylneuraminic acid synthetase
MNRIAALVPMRHHSQRVPGKNYRLLDGKPLYQHIIETLLNVPAINEVVVDTDSEIIMDGLLKEFPQVRRLPRPAHLQADDIPMNDILLYDTSQVPADFYLQTHSTNPLLRAVTISNAIRKFLTDYQTRLYDKDGKALNHNPRELLQTQDLPPVYEENSCIYIFTRQNLLKRQHRIGENPCLYEVDSAEAWDIDEELDFELVDFLMKRRKA